MVKEALHTAPSASMSCKPSEATQLPVGGTRTSTRVAATHGYDRLCAGARAFQRRHSADVTHGARACNRGGAGWGQLGGWGATGERLAPQAAIQYVDHSLDGREGVRPRGEVRREVGVGGERDGGRERREDSTPCAVRRSHRGASKRRSRGRHVCVNTKVTSRA